MRRVVGARRPTGGASSSTWKNKSIDRMQCIDRLNEACLPTGDALLPTEEQRLPTVRCASYQWTKVFFAWKKCVGPAFASRLPMGCTPSDDRSSTCPEWEKIVGHVEEPHWTNVQDAASDGVHHAGQRIVHVFRAGEEVVPRRRSASDGPAHHGPMMVHHGGGPTVLVFRLQEAFLPGACHAMYDRKKQCPRA